ncbi:GNAT family N-acetyltransferase [Nocardia sp. NPDC004260]
MNEADLYGPIRLGETNLCRHERVIAEIPSPTSVSLGTVRACHLTPGTSIVLDAVRLRPLRASDEQVIRAAHEAMADSDGFPFALGLTPAMPWRQYLSALEDCRHGINLPDGIVAATYLVATVDDQVVGRTSIRHTLNDGLRQRGGHIGYGVLTPFRHRGYGTAILRYSLTVARAIGSTGYSSPATTATSPPSASSNHAAAWSNRSYHAATEP